ncbi:MAG: hypothetical protein ACK451_15250 [Pseudanabaena sp.]
MTFFKKLETPNSPSQPTDPEPEIKSHLTHASQQLKILLKIKGVFLLTVGYLLSPLCWWNDLIINLPIACGFGYVVSLWSSEWFFPAAIAGYWLSNLIGIVFMQIGATDILQKNTAKKRSLKQELLTGVMTSTAYTFVIVALVYFHIIDLSTILPTNEQFSLAFLNPRN